ncbi:hypothetical protein C5167_015141, partial [Papaver somniferum]
MDCFSVIEYNFIATMRSYTTDITTPPLVPSEKFEYVKGLILRVQDWLQTVCSTYGRGLSLIMGIAPALE